ncbi:mediator of RNA polymerase II transcription subunit 14 [Rhypophila decipiens]|uniref:Mediator of RNA polymerase II transcription subunit 14 n=1 Tax=Rhypophila decipiens TaxID=261697 RepID=A0AAN7BBU5_9PEZI|nr:mediator of RNA polymerase II transcription subunit 14 [Rhypophila decipiens]
MENGTQNGVRTNHDREAWVNGINGVAVKREVSPDRSKVTGNMTNGGSGSAMDLDGVGTRPLGESAIHDMSEFDNEIPHITSEIIPLSLIITRLAQFSHATLQDTINTLASKPIPQPVANGASGNYQYTGVEDPSQESRDKKLLLLATMEQLHHKWTKALVLTEWGKKAQQVGKLIDIKSYLWNELNQFDQIFSAMVEFKRSLHYARVPSPDLKTALEILSSGDVSWMTDLGYVEPPPLTEQQNEEWLEEVNTLLSVRLTYEDYDTIPTAFKDFTIDNGRVTFRVENEFEVDLTIADDDFKTQYWFIDFRFLFSPASPGFPADLRPLLEKKVNKVLEVRGLEGCYDYLHGFVLTQKVTEFWRQGQVLAKERWIDTLKVERLHRAMSIQYWLNRPHSQNTKSWIILGVHSGDFDGVHDVKMPSRLVLRWFRDGKEVPVPDISFDEHTISTEDLLTTVIAHHTEYYLTQMCNRLLSKPRFTQREGQLDLEISNDVPQNSSITMQLFGKEKASIRLEPITGAFVLSPLTPIMLEGQNALNSSNNPAEEGPGHLERIRWICTTRDLQSRSRSIGWNVFKSQISNDDLKKIVYSNSPASREPFQSVWMQKRGWNSQWYVVVSMSLGGDQWFLVQLTPPPNPGTPPRLKMFTRIPMTSGELTLSEEFFQNLAVYTTGIVSQITDLRELHANKLAHTLRESVNYCLPSQIKLPAIHIRLSDLLRSRGAVKDDPMPWAKHYIPILFQGIRTPTSEVVDADGSIRFRRDGRVVKVLAEARLEVTDRTKFRGLRGKIDDDVFFDARRGQFILRLRADMGTPFVNILGDRIKALERVVDFVDAIRHAGEGVVPEKVTLREVSFTYSRGKPAINGQHLPPWRVRLDLTHEAGVKVHLDKGNPHMRVLETIDKIAQGQCPGSLPRLILATLPLYRGLEAIEDEWTSINLQNPGCSLQISPRNVSWVHIRFTYPSAPGGLRRHLGFDIWHKDHRSHPRWLVTRPEHVDPFKAGAKMGASGPGAAETEFDRLLAEKVWSVKAPGIKGLGDCCAVDLQTGIEPLLSIISNAAKSYIGTLPPQMQNPGPVAAPGGVGGGGLQQQPPQGYPPQQQQQQQEPPRPNPQQPPAPMPNLNNRFAQQRQQQQQQQQAMMGGQMQMMGQNNPPQGGNQHRGPVGSKNNAVVVLD